MLILTTSMSSANYKPFMLAFDRLDDATCPASISINVFEDIFTGYFGSSSRQHIKRDISLVPCTKEHFSVTP
jgi:hypothetical protein